MKFAFHLELTCLSKSITNRLSLFPLANSGGLTNVLFLCSLPSTHTSLNGEPSQVLMRMYGQIHSTNEHDSSVTKITESVIFMMLSERNLGECTSFAFRIRFSCGSRPWKPRQTNLVRLFQDQNSTESSQKDD